MQTERFDTPGRGREPRFLPVCDEAISGTYTGDFIVAAAAHHDGHVSGVNFFGWYLSPLNPGAIPACD